MTDIAEARIQSLEVMTIEEPPVHSITGQTVQSFAQSGPDPKKRPLDPRPQPSSAGERDPEKALELGVKVGENRRGSSGLLLPFAE